MRSPTIASTSGRSVGRPETVAPNTTSDSPLNRASSRAKAPCSTVLTVSPFARANAVSRADSAPSRRSMASTYAAGLWFVVRTAPTGVAASTPSSAVVQKPPGRDLILSLQPLDEGAVRRRRAALRLPAVAHGRVDLDCVAQDQRDAPSVEQEMVATPDEHKLACRDANEREHGRAGDGRGRRAAGGPRRGNARAGWRDTRPRSRLQSWISIGTGTARATTCMGRRPLRHVNAVRRMAYRSTILCQASVKVRTSRSPDRREMVLIEIRGRIRGQEGMEEQPFLQRRQRIDVLDVRGLHAKGPAGPLPQGRLRHPARRHRER